MGLLSSPGIAPLTLKRITFKNTKPSKAILKYFASAVLCLGFLFTHAQKQNSRFRLHIRTTTEPVSIDGSADDGAWQDAETAGNFFMVLPMDTSKARVNTEVKMTYDKENLYIIAICHLPAKATLHGRIATP